MRCDKSSDKSSDRRDNALNAEKYQDHILWSFAHKVLCVDNKFSKPIILYRGKNAVNRFMKVIPQKYYYCK